MFNQLTIRERLMVLSAAFLIPVVALLYFLVDEQSLAIDFARKELAGIEYLRAMRPLMADLLEQRDLRVVVRATGDASRTEDLDRRIEAVDRSFEVTRRASRTLSIPLVSTTQIDSIHQLWIAGARSRTATGATDTSVLAESLRHIVAVGNESNLVLDPDVDSYYCMDAVIFKLPKLLTELSDARGQAFETLSGAAGDADAATRQREMLQALAVALREALDAAADNIDFGFRANATVEGRLGPRFREIEARVEGLIAALSGASPEPPRAEALYADITTAIDGTFATYDATLDALQQLVEARVLRFQQRQILSFSIVIPGLIVGLWVVVLLHRDMEGRNKELSAANTQSTHLIQELEVAVGKYEAQTQELARSNSDLQQFAYVASHDLQEPLRIVSSYAQLFEQRYKGQVDEKGQKWIFYMVDASKRMQALIEDLLMYSRVGTKAKEPAPVDSGLCVDTALANLRLAIQRSGADITRDPMPAVVADGLQLTQLFQNLVGNAIKYRDDSRPPAVHIGAELNHDALCHFSVRDNGIGIDPRFHDRIFGLFQRLHERGKFEGTGIGLAVCKKIVERHGGTIWVESEQGRGSIFHFTLPLAASAAVAAATAQGAAQGAM
jgi:signal transduction histidine kinase